MVHQGGMPHGASAVMSAPVINLMPHVMDQDDIDAFVREYAASARLSLEGRADGVEVHLNHDDIHEWFLSPFTNQRTDRYGGSLENRTRFAVETLQAIRDEVGSALTVGVRLNIREEVPGGYDVAGGVEIAQYLESTGLIDYVHGVVGSPVGQPQLHPADLLRPGAVVRPGRRAHGRPLDPRGPHRPDQRPRRGRAGAGGGPRGHRRDGAGPHRRGPDPPEGA